MIIGRHCLHVSNLAEMAESAAVPSSASASALKAAGRLAMAADAEHVFEICKSMQFRYLK